MLPKSWCEPPVNIAMWRNSLRSNVCSNCCPNCEGSLQFMLWYHYPSSNQYISEFSWFEYLNAYIISSVDSETESGKGVDRVSYYYIILWKRCIRITQWNSTSPSLQSIFHLSLSPNAERFYKKCPVVVYSMLNK